MPYRIFFPILFESLTHQMSVSLLCGFCTPKGCLKFWTPFEQCMWFLKIMWKKTILKTKFFVPIQECGQKSVQRKIFWSKNSKKLKISWKILCQIETLTKQFPQAWDTNMPYRIFFPIYFESLTHQMSVFLLCGFCTPKRCLKFWTPFEQCIHVVFENYVKSFCIFCEQGICFWFFSLWLS